MNRRLDFRKILEGFIVISRAVFALCFFLVFLDLLSVTFNGFGVDSAGRLYVGRGQHIEVWENGEQVDNIRKGTSRGHAFTVLEDDTILIASGNNVWIMDLEGTTFLESWEEENKETYETLSDQRIFTTVTGERYIAGSAYGRLTILQGETVIYQEPLWECVFGWLFVISFPCVFVSFIIEKIMNREDDYPSSRFKFDPRN